MRKKSQRILLVLAAILAVFLVAKIDGVYLGATIFWSLISAQALFTLFLMLYSLNDWTKEDQYRSPKDFYPPKLSFSAIIPVFQEEKVIAQTIRAVAAINYPEGLKEIIVSCRHGDTQTIEIVDKTIADLGKENISRIAVYDEPKNKPNQLNWALERAKNDVVVIFDAEDQPHKDIYQVANTVMLRDRLDVLQSGVQLVNFTSSWFSALNVLEYYFWFKSALHFFAHQGVVPLGGNTVFFKRSWLTQVDGWDEECLTEDAEIGLRLSGQGAEMGIVYDELHATQEETPATLDGFLKQRTRWDLGFMQIFLKKEWLKLPGWTKKFLAGYILLLPQVLAGFFVLIPLSAIFALTIKMPLALAILSFVPLMVLLLGLLVLEIGLWQFTRDYRLRYPTPTPIRLLIAFPFYIVVLGLGAFRALARLAAGNLAWEKTVHVNAHRSNTI